MSSAGRRLSRRQRREVDRTMRGSCARCGASMQRHARLPSLRCPDGRGTFTWALDADGQRRAIERLEALIATADDRRSVPLSPDAQAVLERMVDLANVTPEDAAHHVLIEAMRGEDAAPPLGDPMSSRQLAAALGWSIDRVKLALVELREARCISGGEENPS